MKFHYFFQARFLLYKMVKGVNMKKAITYIIILLVLGAIFGISMHQNRNPVLNSGLDIISPAVAFADSDTVGAPKPPPPPPPIN